MIAAPFSLTHWIADNRHLLVPPVANRNLYNEGGFMLFVVGGPNQRTDWHIDPREELFYQIEGDMLLRVVDDGAFADIWIREGELFRLPPMVPHSPQRFEGTLGVVCEYARDPGEFDGVRWYCQGCGAVLHEQWVQMLDTTTQLAPIFEGFYGDVAARTCGGCGAVHPAPGR